MEDGGESKTARRRHALGERLRQLRRERGLTQERLANGAHFDRSFYVDVENGHHSLTVDRLFALADELEVRVSELLVDID